ncbi:MAG TPA: hypothetical protein VLD35_12520 [Caldimonas sp.]|nr:hypothetical protein [Caldimonas sp.]
MRHLPALLALCTLALAVVADVGAAPGDVYVPAHRTRDGHYVPPNVRPSSAGTHQARRPASGQPAHRRAPARLAPPLLVDAREVRH